MSQALQHLCQLADQRKAELSPNVPAKYIPRSKYSDKDANSLTRCIVDWFTLNGHFATRLASTGTYRTDIQKFVSSQQRAGMPDVSAVVCGRAVYVEIKVGKDRLSDAQRETMNALVANCAYVYVAHSFQGFYDFYQQYIVAIPPAGPTPYFERHPIPHLATPDLPPLFNPTINK